MHGRTPCKILIPPTAYVVRSAANDRANRHETTERNQTMTTQETAAEIRAAFTYWGHVPNLSPETHEPNLRRAHRGHWFDADTLRFFGSTNRELVAGGVMVELQRNAPDGLHRYSVTVWVIDPDTGNTSPVHFGRFPTRAAATRYARTIAATWKEAQQ